MTKQQDNLPYLQVLERWMKGAKPYLYTSPDHPELTCYGSGDNGWGVQTNQKAFAAFGMLAAHRDFHPERAGMEREEVQDIALRLLRFSLRSHMAGDIPCTDGTSWGHTWISGLGLERMMHAVDAIDSLLTAEDRLLLRNVLVSESEWLLDQLPVEAGLYAREGKNKPESNLWNGALLYRTAAMYPDHARAEQFRGKGLQFLLNSLTVPADEQCQQTVDGIKVADAYVGANFFSSYALNHHGYLNVGYMNMCLSNTAMLHFSCRRHGWSAPEALYRNVRPLWELIKKCTFPDGRLLRIGGDSRVRYTYCQDFAVPVWLLIRDLFPEEAETCSSFESEWLRLVVKEMDASGDGTFLSARCSSLAQQSPLYASRLESDRAVSMSFGAAWGELAGAENELSAPKAAVRVSPEEISVDWHDEYHGAYLHRSGGRIASWVWEAAEKPQGLCVPPQASDMAEWRSNLAGRIEGLGKVSEQKIQTHGGRMFAGGFITWGSMLVSTQGLLAEQKSSEDIAVNRIICAALPDDAQMIVLQYAEALDRRIYVTAVKGLHLLVPNDVYNDNHRMYHYEHGALPLHGYGSTEDVVRTGSKWLNIDDKLGVVALYGTNELSVVRPARRQIGLRPSLQKEEKEGTLYANEICGACRIGLQSMDARQTIWDAGYVLQSSVDHSTTARYGSDAQLACAVQSSSPYVRSVHVRGMNGCNYMLLANFGEQEENVSLSTGGKAPIDISTNRSVDAAGNKQWSVALPSGEGMLLRL